MTIEDLNANWLHAIAVSALLVLAVPTGVLNAQGLDSAQSIDKIIGSEVTQEEKPVIADEKNVIAAIERTGETIGEVRKTSMLDKIDIVFLTDAARSEGGPPPAIESKVKEHEAEVAELRQEIEANALFFHAIDSRRVLAQDVLAISFDGPRNVTVYAAAKPAK